MSSIKMQLQNAFLNKLRRDLKHQPGIETILWKLSYSFMSLIFCYSEEQKIDLNKNETIIDSEINGDTFKLLLDYGFIKDFTRKIKIAKKEIHYVWKKVRDKDHPHGKVSVFATMLGVNYRHDKAGSCWKREHGSQK